MAAPAAGSESFSALSPSILEREGRLRIGRQILNVLQHHLRRPLTGLRVLDIGCSSGVITDLIAAHAAHTTGIDVDRPALAEARRRQRDGLEFQEMSGDALRFPAATFDVVVCNQVYYWFEDAPRFFGEIHRVLKPGGICFFAAVNKYKPWESQYRLPLLPLLPRPLADLMVRAAGKGDRFGCHYLSVAELRRQCHQFVIHPYTPKLLKDPEAFGFSKLAGVGLITRRLPLPWLARLEALSPNIIWVLERPREQDAAHS